MTNDFLNGRPIESDRIRVERRWAFDGARRMQAQAAAQARQADRIARIRAIRPIPAEAFVGTEKWTVPPAPSYPEREGNFRVALALGGGREVYAEIERAYALLGREFDLVVACNDIGAEWAGKLDHWVTLHPDKMPDWEKKRRANNLPGGYQIHFHRQCGYRGEYRVSADWSGSSGLLAVKVAIEQGAERVICAGIPMTKSAHYNSHPNKVWRYADYHQRGWRNHMAELRGRVRSMSGWTMDLLGAPDRAWLGMESQNHIVDVEEANARL